MPFCMQVIKYSNKFNISSIQTNLTYLALSFISLLSLSPLKGMEAWFPLVWTSAFLVTFLAHLSRRLTRWAYSIPIVRRPSVVLLRRPPHFQTWISLKPVGQSWSNFMCSITGVGERLHMVLGQIGSKLWLATESSHWLTMGKTMSPPFLCCFWCDPFCTCR